jgi:hypothetical protein
MGFDAAGGKNWVIRDYTVADIPSANRLLNVVVASAPVLSLELAGCSASKARPGRTVD